MVSTWGIRGHFRASCGYERAAETAVGRRGETADRRTDVGSRRIGSTGRAGAWGECQPSISVAQAVSAKVAGSREHRDGEFASGSGDGSAGPRSCVVEWRDGTPNRVGNDPGGTAQGTSSHHRQYRCGIVARGARVFAGMIGLAAGTQIWIVAGVTDMRRGFVGLSGMVQTALEQNPFSGQVFVFRGKRGDLIKVLWWDGDGLCLLAKRLERGRFIWPQATSGTVWLTPAQLSMLLEGIDWRRPLRTQTPQLAV